MSQWPSYKLGSAVMLPTDTYENWTNENPVVIDQFIVVESDTGRQKIGDGVTHYNDLPYITGASALSFGQMRIDDDGFLNFDYYGELNEQEFSLDEDSGVLQVSY